MLKADSAAVAWDPDKKAWRVKLQIGEEVIKRPCDKKIKRDAADDTLRTLALETARSEGYELEPAQVKIAR